MAKFLLDILIGYIHRIILLASSLDKYFDHRGSDVLVAHEDNNGGEEVVGGSRAVLEDDITHHADVVKDNLANNHVD